MTDLPSETIEGYAPWHPALGFRLTYFRRTELAANDAASYRNVILEGFRVVPVTITITATGTGERK